MAENMRTVQIEHMRPHEILEAKERKSIAYLPLGPLEWHGPGMPYGTDPLSAEAGARQAALRTGGVVIPTLYLGTERERPDDMLDAIGLERGTYVVGMDFPSNTMPSYYAREEIFSIVVREYLRMLTQQGYRLIVLVNGHGAANQVSVLERLAVEFSAETDCRVIVEMAIAHFEDDDTDMGHATALETSIQMHLNPENVDMSKLPSVGKLNSRDWGIVDGCTFALQPNKDKIVIYDPRTMANQERGAKYLAAGVDKLVNAVEKAWAALG